MAGDLRRFLNNEPTEARPLATWELLGKWARRHPGLAVVLSMVLVVLPIVTLIISQKNSELSAALKQAQAGESSKAQTLYGLRMRTAWEAFNSGDFATMDEMLKHYEGRVRRLLRFRVGLFTGRLRPAAVSASRTPGTSLFSRVFRPMALCWRAAPRTIGLSFGRLRRENVERRSPGIWPT